MRTVGNTVNPPTPLTNNEAVTADLAIDPVLTTVTEEGTNWKLRARILNQNGDDCASTCSRAVISLPTETKVISVSTANGSRVDNLGWKQCGALIEVDLPQLCPGTPNNVVDITVVVEKSNQMIGKCTPTFAVSVRSDTPDTYPQNNYWWWYRRCEGSSTTLGAPVTGPGH